MCKILIPQFLGQKEAQLLDEDLMGKEGFSIDQLMELAGTKIGFLMCFKGLSVAASVAKVYKKTKFPRILAICGPGSMKIELHN
jgi:NAD(P)H-hydrate repair Nnr-like enzyme with NAD(P)H-hydrate epimerase domain